MLQKTLRGGTALFFSVHSQLQPVISFSKAAFLIMHFRLRIFTLEVCFVRPFFPVLRFPTAAFSDATAFQRPCKMTSKRK